MFMHSWSSVNMFRDFTRVCGTFSSFWPCSISLKLLYLVYFRALSCRLVGLMLSKAMHCEIPMLPRFRSDVAVNT